MKLCELRLEEECSYENYLRITSENYENYLQITSVNFEEIFQLIKAT